MLDHLGQTKRTHNCGALRQENAGQTITLMGWVNSYRDQGQLLFIHLRDREGITQIVFDEGVNAELLAQAKQVRREFVISITGVCVKRDEANFNAVMATGEVEVAATEIKFLNDAQTPPFELENCVASEELRLKYRYLDLRRVEMQKNFRLRHKLALAVRNYLDTRGFFEIETPILTKSTPEGARDYLVPARTAAGKFYALPQSPQLFKQLLMIGGYDKYFQIARCFRDEDLRADRQPEFTQIDMEMSFVQPDDVFDILEPMVCECFKVAGIPEPARPFQRMPYSEAMNKYGSDKPDLRFGLEMMDLSENFANGAFPVFAEAVAKGGAVKAIVVKGAATWSRKTYDEIGEHAKRHGAGGLAYIQVIKRGPSKLEQYSKIFSDEPIVPPENTIESKSALTKFLDTSGIESLIEHVDAKTGDSILMIGGKWDVACNAMGQVRLEIARRENLINEAEHKMLWVVDFPMFEFHPEDKRYYAMHHPFTSPIDEDINNLEGDLGKVRAKAYDLVMNGSELGGGSIRIHRSDIQAEIFKALGLSDEEAKEKFGFFLEALSYGTPPHGGIALGLDRMVMLFAGAKSLRDVIAFPKVASGSDLMTDSPSEVDKKQLDELKIKTIQFS